MNRVQEKTGHRLQTDKHELIGPPFMGVQKYMAVLEKEILEIKQFKYDQYKH